MTDTITNFEVHVYRVRGGHGWGASIRTGKQVIPVCEVDEERMATREAGDNTVHMKRIVRSTAAEMLRVAGEKAELLFPGESSLVGIPLCGAVMLHVAHAWRCDLASGHEGAHYCSEQDVAEPERKVEPVDAPPSAMWPTDAEIALWVCMADGCTAQDGHEGCERPSRADMECLRGFARYASYYRPSADAPDDSGPIKMYALYLQYVPCSDSGVRILSDATALAEWSKLYPDEQRGWRAAYRARHHGKAAMETYARVLSASVGSDVPGWATWEGAHVSLRDAWCNIVKALNA